MFFFYSNDSCVYIDPNKDIPDPTFHAIDARGSHSNKCVSMDSDYGVCYPVQKCKI